MNVTNKFSDEILFSYERDGEDRRTSLDEKSKDNKQKHKKRKGVSDTKTKQDINTGKKLKPEDQIRQAMFADIQRKKRLSQKHKSPSSSSSDSSDDEKQQSSGLCLYLMVVCIFR